MPSVSKRQGERIAFLIGPTAVGKTTIGIELARLLNAEILSLDARQIYKELELGTAKPTEEECNAVPHHLINLFDPTTRVSAVMFEEHFKKAINDLNGRGVGALCVGGSGLYVDACLGRLDRMPPADETIRAEHNAQRKAGGTELLHSELAKIDPVTASRLSPLDFQRISRALEVFKLTGKPISSWQKHSGPMDLSEGPPMILLMRPREQLYERIEQRAGEMIRQGLLREIEALIKRGIETSAPAFESIGYVEFARAIAGEITIEEATAIFIQRTRRYAKRQITWFRNRYQGIHEISISENDTPAKIAGEAAEIISRDQGWLLRSS